MAKRPKVCKLSWRPFPVTSSEQTHAVVVRIAAYTLHDAALNDVFAMADAPMV
jgi:hypothetical protein